MRFALEGLNPAMRAQAAEKIAALSKHKVTHICTDEGEKGVKRRVRLPKALNSAEERLAFYLKAEGILGFEREYRFDATRQWRFDFANPGRKLALEVDGGVWTGGRHLRGKGFSNDLLKLNAATLAGWRVLRFIPEWVKSGIAMRQIKKALERD